MKKDNIFEIKRLVNDVKINLECYEVIRNYINERLDSEDRKIFILIEQDIMYFVLISINHLSSSILTINTLLNPSKKEISPYKQEELPSAIKKELNKIKNKFSNTKIHELRHKIIAHKTKPDAIYLLNRYKIMEGVYKDVKHIYDKLNEWLIKNFKNEYHDLILDESYLDAIKYILKLVVEDKMKAFNIRREHYHRRKSHKKDSE